VRADPRTAFVTSAASLSKRAPCGAPPDRPPHQHRSASRRRRPLAIRGSPLQPSGPVNSSDCVPDRHDLSRADDFNVVRWVVYGPRAGDCFRRPSRSAPGVRRSQLPFVLSISDLEGVRRSCNAWRSSRLTAAFGLALATAQLREPARARQATSASPRSLARSLQALDARIWRMGVCCAALVEPCLRLRRASGSFRGCVTCVRRQRHPATAPGPAPHQAALCLEGWSGHSPRGINASTTRNTPRLSALVPARAAAAGADAAPDCSNSRRSPSASMPALVTLA